MSKKIILLGAIAICTFAYWCGSQKSNDMQLENTEDLETIDNTVGITDVSDVIVAEKNDWYSIISQWWGRSGDVIEIDETDSEDID